MPVMEAIVRQVVRAVVKPNLHPRVSIATQRKRLDLLRFVPMPHGIRETETTLAGVPARRLTPSVSTGAILYLHGGAYCIGSPASHKEMVARVARTTEREAFLIDYRLDFALLDPRCHLCQVFWLGRWPESVKLPF